MNFIHHCFSVFSVFFPPSSQTTNFIFYLLSYMIIKLYVYIMEMLTVFKSNKQNIDLLLSLNHIELKVLIYLMLIVNKNNVVKLDSITRGVLCDNLNITTQKLSTALSSLACKNILRKSKEKIFTITSIFIFDIDYKHIIEKIHNQNYFIHECNI